MAYFAVIADAGSIRAAAERLRLSVPVVSAALAELEAELGVSLAVRTTRSFQLTDAGHRVRGKAVGIVALALEALEEGAEDRPLTGRLTLTLPVELATHWAPPILQTFRARHPKVDLRVEESDGVISLHNSDVDLAIRTSWVAEGAGPRVRCLIAADGVAPEWQGTGYRMRCPLIGTAQSRPIITGTDMSRGDADVTVTFDCVIAVTTKTTAREMVRAGLGAALLLELGDSAGLREIGTDLKFGALEMEVVLRDPMPSREVAAFLKLEPIAALPIVGARP
ncbi:LysR family transcriptional regulator [Hasllibacter sp. MH4015]|uniref:LysR family transcriptional regulator n=1 Tax=Hasllibacter sp. MH4015 TaxID=2854029 RepID=UPI001CD3DDDE|nr:LysR family transcriptional regulator [Hasllibacter sp. MH4015]